MTRGNRDTEADKHKAGGPGKAARAGHEKDGKLGNAPSQNQPDLETPVDKDDRQRPGGDGNQEQT